MLFINTCQIEGMSIQRAGRLIIALIIPQLAGLAGSVFTAPAVQSWYAGLNRPWFVPPNWVFAPAWTTLFLLMGLALFLVWEKKGGLGLKGDYLPFWVQLGLNILWSALFFGMRSPLLGLVEIAFLWVAIAVNIVVFWRVRRAAGWLLVPYIVWVSFAAVLNYNVWLLN
jgi:benzodiazapine receptor